MLLSWAQAISLLAITDEYSLYTVFCRLIGRQFLISEGLSPLWIRMVFEIFQVGGIFLFLLHVSRIFDIIQQLLSRWSMGYGQVQVQIGVASVLKHFLPLVG